MKNHDFNLDIPQDSSIRYIILYRKDPIIQLEAWYRFHNKIYNINDCCNFIKDKLPFYEAFKEKWINDNHLVITYENFLENPQDVITNILKYMFPHYNFDKYLINSILLKHKIELKYIISPKNYEFYKSCIIK
jgi:hypothetical protein